MDFADVMTGLLTGLPVLAVVGPIALLLIEAGLERGLRGAYPAALGATAADTVFAAVAAVVGVAAVGALERLRAWLALGAVVVLVALAARLALGAVGQLRTPAARPGTTLDPGGSPRARGAIGCPPGSAVVAVAPAPAAPAPAAPAPAAPATSPLVLAGGFFGLTAMNPVTIAVFAALVLGGSSGAGTAGWVLGVSSASLVVNLGFVLVGQALGAVLAPAAVAWVRLAAAALIVVLALHFASGAA